MTGKIRRRLAAGVGAIFIVFGSISYSEVITDGTVGAATALVGPQFLIPETLGTTRGVNLFHSFSDFNLSQSESATFSGSVSIQRIFARVTDGSASSIDGNLNVDIQNADLYLMNPRGILFGPNASLNTSGSLIATSADHLQLTDGGRFDALLPTADVLTTAPPSAFGFTAPHPAPITLQGSKLEVSADSKILMIGGDLTINGDNDASGDAQLAAAGGQIGLIGVGSAGDALFAADGMLIDVTGFTTLGDVKLQNTAVIDASGLGGGEVTVQGAGFTIDNATIQANTTGAEPGQGVTLALSGHLLMDNNGLIESSTTGDGQAGRIDIEAASIDLQRGAQIRSVTEAQGSGASITLTAQTLTANDQNTGDRTGVRSIAYENASGRSADVSVRAGTVNLTGTEISTTTEGTGAGGNLIVEAGSVQTQGSEVTRDLRRVAGFAAVVGSKATGQGGDVDLSAAEVAILNGGEVSATTFGPGSSGNLSIAADTIRIDDLNTGNFTSIRAQAWSTGDAGTIDLTADLLRIYGGDLTGSAFNAGDGSDITINATKVHLETSDGRWLNDQSYSGIQAGVHNRGGLSEGRAGDVTITATELDITNRGIISARTDGLGQGGNITLNLDRLNISEKGRIVASSRGPADGGTVVVNAQDILIEVSENNGPEEKFYSNGGIEVTTSGSGAGGDALVNADTLTIKSTHGFRPAGIIAQTTTGGGAAGSLYIDVGELVLLGDAQIQASTIGAGRAGDITVKANTILLDAEQSASEFAKGIVAETSNPDMGSGAGGNILVEVGTLQMINGAAVTAGSGGFGPSGELRINAESVEVKSGARISVSTDSTGIAQGLTVLADHVLVDGAGIRPTGIFSSSGKDANAQGEPGSVSIDARLVEVLNAGEISATTFGQSKGGDVIITADQLDVNDLNTGNFTSVRAQAWARGDAGDIFIIADVLNVIGGDVSGSTFSTGEGGAITIDAGQIHLETSDGRWANDKSYSGIHAGAHNRGGISEGNAGDVTITADSLTLINRGIISARTDGIGKGGDILIDVDQLELLDRGRIIATTRGQGAGGTVIVNASDILILVSDNAESDEKFVSSGGIEVNSRNDKDASAPGNAGSATIIASTLTIDTALGFRPGGIFANTISPVGGSAGNLTIDVVDLTLRGQSQILASTSANGNAGSLFVSAENLNVEGTNGAAGAGIFTRSDSTALDAGSAGVINVAADYLSLSQKGEISSASAGPADAGSVTVMSSGALRLSDGSSISVESAGGNAGTINLQATEYLYLDQSEITARAGVDGGNVAMEDTRFVVVQGDQSHIIADAGRDGGDISLDMQYLLISPLGVDDVITAKGDAGIDGEITLASPSIDLSGFVVDLAPEFFSVLPELYNYCASMLAGTDLSGFTISGMGGLPLEPAGLQLSAPKTLFRSGNAQQNSTIHDNE